MLGWLPDQQEPSTSTIEGTEPVSTSSPSKESPLEDRHEDDQLMETPKPHNLPQRELRNRGELKPSRRLIELMLAEIDEPENFSQALNSLNKQHWEAAM